MRKKKSFIDTNTPFLPMPLPENPINSERPTYSAIEHPIWTKNKATLIARYLKFFCFVTHHGSYIDGFAGPQRINEPSMWSAKLVLENKPKQLKNFYLFEQDKKKVSLLEELKHEAISQDLEERIKRNIIVEGGDCNLLIPELLNKKEIGKKEATFCLLDQRTFECHWATVKALANYEKSDYKIELFYFLAESWLNRAFKAVRYEQQIIDWWGNNNWKDLRKINSYQRAKFVSERFITELGYKYATPWPIYSKEVGGRIQYFMIHATDHLAAPKLMNRAYKQAVSTRETPEQLKLMFDEEGIAVDKLDSDNGVDERR